MTYYKKMRLEYLRVNGGVVINYTCAHCLLALTPAQADAHTQADCEDAQAQRCPSCETNWLDNECSHQFA